MSTGHAKLSASGSKKWLSCTPSAELEKQFPDSTSGYAEEGTLAHSVGELKLRRALGLIAEKVASKELKRFEKNKLYEPSIGEATDQYATIVLEKFAEAKQRSTDAIIKIEQRLDFSQWVPEGFGTGDAVIIADELLEIIDYKNGVGVAVDAEDNSQMRLYALGAVASFAMLYDFNSVRMTIVQPRRDSVSSEEITIKDLLDWAETYVKPRAELAIKGEGEFVPGSHCQFCRAKAICRARAEANLELAKMDFKKGELLTDDEIGEVLRQADQLTRWASDVKEWAFNEALNNGKKWDGWKLVEGRSNRVYSDPKKVIEVLEAAKIPEEKIYEPKALFGITALTEKIGKKLFETLVSSYLIKPPGKPTLVTEDDKREEWKPKNTAAEDFKDEPTEDLIG
jgi:hypothetical protein